MRGVEPLQCAQLALYSRCHTPQGDGDISEDNEYLFRCGGYKRIVNVVDNVRNREDEKDDWKSGQWKELFKGLPELVAICDWLVL